MTHSMEDGMLRSPPGVKHTARYPQPAGIILDPKGYPTLTEMRRWLDDERTAGREAEVCIIAFPPVPIAVAKSEGVSVKEWELTWDESHEVDRQSDEQTARDTVPRLWRIGSRDWHSCAAEGAA